MEERRLGGTGLTVSAVGFGCGAVGGLMVRGEPEEQRRAVERALEAGFRYFDTARSYGDGRSEENLGRVLGELGAWERVVVGTKFRVDPPDFSDIPGAIRRSLEGSLRRLRHERVDLFQLHNRIVEEGGRGADGALTVEQVLGPVVDGLQALRETGLVGHVGITAMGETAAVRRVVQSGRFGSAQVYFNAVNPSAGYAGRADADAQDFEGLIDRAAESNVGVIVIRPFAAGAIAGEVPRHANAGDPGGLMAGTSYMDDQAHAAALADLAGPLGLESPLELALRFALAKEGVSTVLVGLSDAGQLEDAIRWAGRGPLEQHAVERILKLRGG